MFKPASQAVGVLCANIISVSNVIIVDANMYAQLFAVLGENGTDHTYLNIGEAPYVETVRVTSLSAGALTVIRGVDGTIAKPFNAGENIQYELVAAAVQDLMQQTLATSVVITADPPLEVEQIATNVFHITLQPLNVTSDDGSVVITGTWPDIQIAVNKAASGCCN